MFLRPRRALSGRLRRVAVPATATNELARAQGDSADAMVGECFCARDGRSPGACGGWPSRPQQRTNWRGRRVILLTRWLGNVSAPGTGALRALAEGGRPGHSNERIGAGAG